MRHSLPPGVTDLNRSTKMKEPGNPKASILFAIAFLCAMAAAGCAIAVRNPMTAGMFFVVLFLASIVLLIAGLVVGWRNRKKQFEFVEPTRPVPRFFMRAFRIVAGFLLTASGGFMVFLSFAMLARGDSFPLMGLLMGVSIGGFGLKGLLAGLKGRPNSRGVDSP